MVKKKTKSIFYPDKMEHLSRAIFEAYEAFNDYFEIKGLDGAYWDMKVIGYCMDSNFDPFADMTFDFNFFKAKRDLHKGEKNE